MRISFSFAHTYLNIDICTHTNKHAQKQCSYPQYPGPDERGLQWQRDMTATFPRTCSGWMGPFFPMIMVSHPETVKVILKTSGESGIWGPNTIGEYFEWESVMEA